MGKQAATTVLVGVFAVVLSAGALSAEAEGVGLGHGGVLVGLLPLDFAPLNVALTEAGYPAVEGPLVVFGGGGAGGILGGTVFGGLGFGGTSTKLAGEKRTDLELGYGGVVIELTRRASPAAVLGVGGVLGGGSLDLTARSRYPVDFADSLASPPTSRMSVGFLGGIGYLRLQVQAVPWLALEGWAGYFVAFPGQWEEGGREIAGPRLDLLAPFLAFRASFGAIGLPEEPEAPTE